MTRSFLVGTLMGGPVRLHWSWIALPVGVTVYSFATRTWHEAGFFTFLLVAIYAAVAIHELGECAWLDEWASASAI